MVEQTIFAIALSLIVCCILGMCSGGMSDLVVWCMSCVGHDGQVHHITLHRTQGRYSLIINTEIILKWLNGSCLISLDGFCGDSGRSHDTMTLYVKRTDETGTQPFMRTTFAKPLFTSWLLTVIPFN